MISNLRISVAELVIWALLATAGLAWTVARVFDGIERAWAWLTRPRIDPPWWWKPWLSRRVEDEDDDELRAWADEEMGYFDGPPPLPPERTWEQMTSHQLPLTAVDLGLPSVQTQLGAARERRAPWWEAEHRAAYESLGFDYPSGLMARVRELAP